MITDEQDTAFKRTVIRLLTERAEREMSERLGFAVTFPPGMINLVRTS